MISRRTFVNALSVAFIGLIAPMIGAAAGVFAGGHSEIASGTSILVAALGLRSVRRASMWIARRAIPAAPEPFERLRDFVAGLSQLPSTAEHLPRVAELVAEALRAEWATVSLDVAAGDRLEASWPDAARPPLDGRSVRLAQGGQILGTITVGAAHAAATSPTGSLLEDIAAQVAPFLRNLILVWELEDRIRRLDEQAAQLRDARRRIMAVADRERRRLERNLHDGAQQELMGLIFRLGVAHDVATKAPERLPAVLAELAVMAEDAVTAIVDLGAGAGPRLLREHGLTQALLMHAAHLPVAADVAVEHVQRHPDEIEAAIYFSCLEALQNVLRHAEATRVRLVLKETAAELRFVISDDGRGFDVQACGTGSGLDNLTDRLRAIGGSVDIVSAPGRGTEVTGHVPLDNRILAPA